jgi:uncharacterized repeat protein (TIGR04042 family)
MPELIFSLRWPDGTQTRHYSPSSIVRDFLAPGESYKMPDFLRTARAAMTAASERVERKYGYPCSRAGATLAELEHRGAAFNDAPDAAVTILEIQG